MGLRNGYQVRVLNGFTLAKEHPESEGLRGVSAHCRLHLPQSPVAATMLRPYQCLVGFCDSFDTLGAIARVEPNACTSEDSISIS
jgi:hypothetical protein